MLLPPIASPVSVECATDDLYISFYTVPNSNAVCGMSLQTDVYDSSRLHAG